jgi:hypothetical protein
MPISEGSVLALGSGTGDAEPHTDLRLQLRTDHDHGLPCLLHLRGGLAQVEIVGNSLGDDRVETRVIERLQPIAADIVRARGGTPLRWNRGARGKRLAHHFRVLRRLGERTAGEQRPGEYEPHRPPSPGGRPNRYACTACWKSRLS